MTAKDYLNKLLYIDVDINSRQEELDQVRADLTSVPTSKLGESVRETQGAYDDRYTRLFELNEYISKKIDMLYELKEEATKRIDRCSKPKYQVVLRERYINGKDWDAIALSLNMTKRHVFRLHGQALQDFSENNKRCH